MPYQLPVCGAFRLSQFLGEFFENDDAASESAVEKLKSTAFRPAVAPEGNNFRLSYFQFHEGVAEHIT